jgi:hypothetical protein
VKAFVESEVDREPVKLLGAKLILWVETEGANGPRLTDYDVQRIPSHPSIGCPAYILTKPDGECHEVILMKGGSGECSCADWIYCRNHKDPHGCRHVIGLRSVGLLPELK